MNAKQREQLARAVVEHLFVNGNGERAGRLVLMSMDGRDLGGWGELPVYDAVRRLLDDHLSTGAADDRR
jgi:hypothetical protein